jgi:hypothetical protein
MQDPEIIRAIRNQYLAISAQMDERSRRRWAAAESQKFGWGGISAISRATGISPNTIRKGITELKSSDGDSQSTMGSRLRRPGAGRKPLAITSPDLLIALDELIDGPRSTNSDSIIRWTSKNPMELATELASKGFNVSARTISRILKASGFFCPSNGRTKVSLARSNWLERFHQINQHLANAFSLRQPVITVSVRRYDSREIATDQAAHANQQVKFSHAAFLTHPEESQQASTIQALENKRNKMPHIEITEPLVTSIEEAVKRSWDSLDEQVRNSQSDVLIVAEFLMSESSMRRIESNVGAELNLRTQLLSMPPAIRKWNRLQKNAPAYVAECLAPETGLIDQISVHVIESQIPLTDANGFCEK